jgi:hypothetical protein
MWSRIALRTLVTYCAPEKLALLACVSLLLASTESSHAFALLATGAIDMKGNGIATDSFDSSAADYPGYWTNSIRKAGGDVATISTITNFTIGNANIAGHIRTGPGGGYTRQANCSVGDLAWVDGANFGVESGWFTNDMNVAIRDVVIPSDRTWWNSGSGPGEGQAGTVSGVSYAHVFMKANADGNYYILNDSGDVYVDTNTTIKLKAKSNMGTFAPNNIFVAGTGSQAGKLKLYVDCTNCVLGTGNKTQSGLAQNLVFLGTPNCTSLKYNGNGDFEGALYFPQANFVLSGGGSGILDFIGSSVTKTVQINGHYHIHFDEALFHQSLPMLLFSTGPQNRAALLGQDTSLNVSAVGAPPFSYQWRFAGVDIPNATNYSLPLTNIQFASAGLYEAVITNISGSVTSSVQVAVYDSPTPTLQVPTLSTNGLIQVAVAGISDFKYAVEASTNLSDWTRLTTNASPYVFSDTNTVVLPQRFYRAVYVP